MKKEKLPARRIRVLVVIMAIWGLAIGVRLYFLQVVRSDSYIQRASQQQKDVIKVTPRRGDILDRDGNVLASSVQVDSVFARPNQIKNTAATAKALARLTGVPLSELNRKLELDFPLDGPKTLNGLILEHLQDIPEPGTTILVGGHPLEIVQTQEKSVKAVRIYPRRKENNVLNKAPNV